MTELQLLLSPDQRDCLIDLLESATKTMRVEEHRTRAPQYREHLVERGDLMAEILDRLKATALNGKDVSIVASEC